MNLCYNTVAYCYSECKSGNKFCEYNSKVDAYCCVATNAYKNMWVSIACGSFLCICGLVSLFFYYRGKKCKNIKYKQVVTVEQPQQQTNYVGELNDLNNNIKEDLNDV
ncbi:Hypothetical_protein [Hexamita inflata]|uniref:Hypothetical_protein n=1 Tax=Hexamita inflata TaxID=28002 RepID=A0AA86UBJ7_9EUKA|nr:Hypothetical protein HINF_LOCUS36794 [Hexamita inflata]